jgi:wyosine [tRNA(Phe)-imidazoG37] synthetase (radical SAM superfamily)
MGEPTLHPQFEELVDIAKELKEKYRPQTRIGILSNSSTVNVDKVSRALAKLDFRIMKLDAADLETFVKLNRPCQGVSYETIVNGLKSLGDIILQTMFVNGEIQNSSNHQVKEWIQRVGEINPLKSQIYSLHRPPACSSLQEVARKRLQEIATKTQQITGVPVEVIVASSAYRQIY